MNLAARGRAATDSEGSMPNLGTLTLGTRLTPLISSMSHSPKLYEPVEVLSERG